MAAKLWVAGVVIAMVAAGARADSNLLLNGDFDSDAAEWNLATTLTGQFSWVSSADADGCTMSGSGEIGNTETFSDNAETFLESECLPADDATTYRISAAMQFVVQGSGSGYVALEYFSSSTDCALPVGAPAVSALIDDQTAGWQELQASGETPAGTLHVKALVVLRKANHADPSALAELDRVRVVPVSVVDEHDFEIGETCRWSDTSP